jgi:hypothetical protein
LDSTMHYTHLAILNQIVGTRFSSSSKIHPKYWNWLLLVLLKTW